MTETPFNVLVLCTGNSARSILGEALVNALGQGRLVGFSAGSTPKGAPHPMALEVLKDLGHETTTLRSKSWDEFAAPGAPQMHLIVTVCDNAANEICPIWPGHPCQVHWGLSDPAAVEGDGQRVAFEAAYTALKARIERLAALPLHDLSSADLHSDLAAIHHDLPGS